MSLISKTRQFYRLARKVLETIIDSLNPKLPLAGNWDLWKRVIGVDARLYWTCFLAGIAIGQGRDPSSSLAWLIKIVEPCPFSIYISSEKIARCLINGLLVSTKTSRDEYHIVWQRLATPIQQFSIALEKGAKGAWLAHRGNPLMEKLILRDIVKNRPIIIGTTCAMELEVTQPIADLLLPTEVKQLYCSVLLEEEKLGSLELPVIEGVVSGLVLKDAVAAEFAEKIVSRFFADQIRRRGNEHKKPSTEKFNQNKQFEPLDEQTNWTVFLQELWGVSTITEELLVTANIAIESPNDETAKDLLVIEVSDRLETTEVSTDVVDLMITVGGAAIGVITTAVPERKLTPELLRSLIVAKSEFELCIVAVREGLLGKPFTEKASLRERLTQSATARKNAYNSPSLSSSSGFLPGSTLVFNQAASSENTLLLGRRTPKTIGTSAARWAMLPRETATEFTDVTFVGEPDEEIRQVLYAPDLIPVSSLSIASCRQRQADVSQPALTYTEKLPILMYHQVIPSKSAPERWSMTPEVFEEQLCYLRDEGFYSVTLEEWRIAMMKRKPLPGKAVLLTFDDGYLDFYDYAFPLLKQYGFSALAFIITDAVKNKTRNGYSTMGWQEIQELQAEGIEFGSHSVTHPSMTTLNYEEVVRESVRSRNILEQQLRVPINAFCYPYGHVNPIVQHLIGACGYVFGLSVGVVHSTFEDPLLELSRIEIEGTDSLQKFILKVG